MKLQPGARRSTVNKTYNGMEIVIPAKKSLFSFAFLGFWMCAWAFGEVSALRSVMAMGEFQEVALFMIAWLVMWTMAGGLVIYTMLWSFVGKEVISISPQTLKVRRLVFGLGRSKELELHSVKNLRFTPPVVGHPRQNIHLGGIGSGAISFDYGATTHSFGNALDEAEANIIISEINERFKIQ